MRIKKPFVVVLNGMTPEKQAALDVMGRMLGNKYDCSRIFHCMRCNEDLEIFGNIGTYEKPECMECHSTSDVQFVKLRTRPKGEEYADD